MSYVIFDCTQFVTFHVKEQTRIENLKKRFKNLGFNINENREIEARKLAYFEGHFKRTVFELVDQEFLGEFEDWKEVSKPSKKLEEFIRTIVELAKDALIQDLKVIIVNCASEDKEEDEILQLSSSSDTAAEDLFSMSHWNFEVKSDVVILNFE